MKTILSGQIILLGKFFLFEIETAWVDISLSIEWRGDSWMMFGGLFGDCPVVIVVPVTPLRITEMRGLFVIFN